MGDAEYLAVVDREGPADSTDAAQPVSDAVLWTLGERIGDGQATDRADRLPESAANALREGSGPAGSFGYDEFLQRVADRGELDRDAAVQAVRAVAAGLAEVAPAESAATREQLPTEFDRLFDPCGPGTEEAFLETARGSPRSGLLKIACNGLPNLFGR